MEKKARYGGRKKKKDKNIEEKEGVKEIKRDRWTVSWNDEKDPQ